MSQKVSTNIPGINIFDSRFLGIYRGIVKDNNDPLQLGRVKVQVFPMFENIKTENLPWAICSNPLWDGSGDGTGWFAPPKLETRVYVLFEEGSCYQPIVIGEAPDKVVGQPLVRKKSYPNRKVLRDSSTEIYVDTLREELQIAHIKDVKGTSTGSIKTSSGEEVIIHDAYITIDANGKIRIYSRNMATVSAPQILLEGNVNVTSGDTGTFATVDGKTVTVVNGIVTNIKAV